MSKKANKRIDFQVMRLIAILFVIINHTAANEYVSTDVYASGKVYYVYLLLAVLSRVAVPIFFMVSGALLVKKQETLETVLKKRVIKYVLIIIGFSIVQFVYHIAMGYVSLNKANIVLWLKNMYSDSVIVPYWFLYAYLALMLMLPLLRKMFQNLDKKEFEYVIVLHLIVFGVLQIVEFFFGIARINLEIPFACNTSIFYFLLGYYADNYVDITKKKSIILGAATLVSVAFMTVMVGTEASLNGFNSCLIVIPTFTIFIIIKKLFAKQQSRVAVDKIKYIIDMAGNAVFGVYLLETIFDMVTFDIYFIALKFVPPILAWLIWAFSDVVVGLIVVSGAQNIWKVIRRKN